MVMVYINQQMLAIQRKNPQAFMRGNINLLKAGYVLDIPGGHGKVPVGPGYLSAGQNGSWQVEDWQGGVHAYRDSTDDTEIR